MAVHAPHAPSDKENRPVSAGGLGAKPTQTRRRSRSSISGPSVKAAAIRVKPLDCTRPFRRTRQVQLPRTLPRPTLSEIDLAAAAGLDPELDGVPLDYVRDRLDALRPQFVTGAASVAPAAAVQNTDWTRITVRVRDDGGDGILPTHMFAVTSAGRDRATLYPCHHLLFAAQCAGLPPIPPAALPEPDADDASLLTLPVAPIYLPSPETFPIVREYIYTRAFDRLLSTLLPIPASELPPIPSESQPHVAILSALSNALVASYALPGLLERAKAIHGVWANVCALGIADDALWKSLETAWAVLIDAIALSTGQKL